MCFYGINTAAIDQDESSLRHCQLKKIGNIVRILEFFVAVVTFLWSVSRSSPYFLAVFDFFRDFLCRFYLLIINHHFVFLLGNGIIVVLFVKFCQFACDNKSAADGDSLSEDEYLIGKVVSAPPLEVTCRDTPPFQEIVHDENLITPTENAVASAAEIHRSPWKSEMKRSQSHLEKTEKIQLQRSKTEHRRNSDGETASFRRSIKADDLSNEEFQQKVEAFIEQHQRFLRQESFSIVSG